MLIVHGHNTILNVGGDSCRRRRALLSTEGEVWNVLTADSSIVVENIQTPWRLGCGQMNELDHANMKGDI